MNETDLQRRIQAALSDADTRLWRNTVGQAWVGNVTHCANGDVLIRNPKRLAFGLAPGSSDLVGLRSVLITQEMVERRVAVFCAVEVKSERGTVTAEQQAFVDMVNGLGGCAGVARSIDEARSTVAGQLPSPRGHTHGASSR